MRRAAKPVAAGVVAVALAGLTVWLVVRSGEQRAEPLGPIPQARQQEMFTTASDCSTDVTAKLNQLIAAMPEQGTITFTKDGCFKVQGRVDLVDRSGLTLEGNGATLRRTEVGPPANRTFAHVFFDGGSKVTVRNLVVEGAHPNGGTADEAYDSSREGQAGFYIAGTKGVTLDFVTATDVYGDFVYVRDQASDITVTNSTFARNGRQGIAVSNGSNVLVKDNRFDDIRRMVIDLEPNRDTDVVKDFRFENNVVGERGLYFASIDDPYVHNLSIIDNQVQGSLRIITTEMETPPTGPGRNWLISGNVSGSDVNKTVVEVRDVQGLTIARNVQRFSDDTPAISLERATDVCIDANDFSGSSMAFTGASVKCPQTLVK